jgi:hypothetical protein
MLAIALSPVEMAAATVPLALYLLLAELASGTLLVTQALRLRGGLTPGFLKFMAVASGILGGLALLTALGLDWYVYRRLLAINGSTAGLITITQALAFIALLGNAVLAFRHVGPRRLWILPVGTSVVLLTALAVTFAPLGGSALDAAAIALAVLVSTVVLGSATTGMLLGHWYLVTPALTNRPLLRAIAWLLVGLVAQAVLIPLALAGLKSSAGSLSHAFGQNPILGTLWVLGAVALPLLAAVLALPACRLRSFMSTTGLLYLAMIAVLPGQLLGQLLLFVAAG